MMPETRLGPFVGPGAGLEEGCKSSASMKISKAMKQWLCPAVVTLLGLVVNTPAQVEVAGQLLIDLHATRGVAVNPDASISGWTNYGTVGGVFNVDGAATTYPSNDVVGGEACVTFDGGDRLKASFPAPDMLTGQRVGTTPDDFSVEYWVYNPAVANEEWILAWARRGTTARFAGFGYGTSAAFGAAAHWGSPDIGFGEGISTAGAASTPPAGFWHHIVITYDGTTERVYTNGVLNAQEAKSLNLWEGDPVTLGQAYEANFNYATGIPFTGSLKALRVHSAALTPSQVLANYAAGMTATGTVPAQLVRLPVSAVLDTSATVNGQLSGAGEPTGVWVFYGPSNADTNKAGWAASTYAGLFTDGAVAVALSGLTPVTTYAYGILASNSLGEVWSGFGTFTTGGSPVIANLAAKGATVTSGYALGQLTATNYGVTQVRLYWGPADGGTDPQAWAGMVDLGVRAPGALAAALTGLTAGTTYYYRYYASNAFGVAWAEASSSFTTKTAFDTTGFNYTATITFGGYTQAEPLFNFPALVVLHGGIAGFDYAQLLSGGADLRFTSADGAELNYEIESWEPGGNSYVWVQVPALTPGAVINMVWGKGGLSFAPYTQNGATWNDGFAGVWHMTNAYVRDSSGNGYHGTSIIAPAAVTTTPGLIGPAQDYNAAVGNGATAVGDIDVTDMTLSAWVWLRDASRDGIFICKDGVIFFWQQGTALRHETLPWGGDTTAPVANAGGVGTWIYVVGTVSGNTQALYTNGVRVASWTKAVPSLNDNPVQIGGVGWGRIMNGKLDEVRVERVGRSPAWVRACYDNQSAPGSFLTFGPVTPLTSPLNVGAPALVDIGMNEVSLTAAVNSDGGNGVSAWGTVLDTAPHPTANALETQGATNAPFTFAQTRTGLNAGGHYYIRAYASNAVEGLKYSPEVEFVTEPEPLSDAQMSAVDNNSVTLSWVAGGGTEGVLVLLREGSAVTAAPLDGTTYAANPNFEMGADLGGGTFVVYAGTNASVTVSGLLPNTVYHAAVYPYAGAGALINYQEDMPGTAWTSTLNEPGFGVAGLLLVDLSAGRGLQFNTTGQVTNWINYGVLGGSFAADGAATTCPGYGTVNGQVAVSFDGGDRLRATFNAPKQVTGLRSTGGAEDFSVEYWVLNPVISNEEWILQWARRGTSPRYAAFGYGTSTAFGVVAHWDWPDMGFDGGVPASNLWHHIVVTYDGTTENVYVDGTLNATETKTLNVWDGDPVTLGSAYNYPPLGYTLPFSGSVAAVRVHSRAMTPAQVAANYGFGMPVVGGPVAILGHPQNRTAVEYGATVFSVSAIGGAPITYQWYRDDAEIPGATESTLRVENVRLADTGARFYCVAANSENANTYTATSAVATLTVVRAADTLQHRYSFTTDASDSVGTAHGELVNNPVIADGAVRLNGVNQYVNLPNGMFTSNNNITVEAWLIDHGSGNWARLWDFGNSTGGEDFPFGTTPSGTSYMFLSPQSGFGTLRGAYTVTGGGAGEQLLEWAGTRLPQGVLKQVVWTSDEATQTGVLYVDGVPVATNTSMTLTPASLGVTLNNWIGRAQFGADAMLNASITEFRIYSQALAPCKVWQTFQLGPDQLLSNDPWTVIALPQNQTNAAGSVASFSITIATCDPLFYQWYQDGNELLDETNATLVLPNVQGTSAGVYEVVVTDALGAEITRASATLAVNTPPVAGDDVAGAEEGQAELIPAALLLANDSDADNDTLTVTAVSALSTNGAVVGLTNGVITYAAPSGFTGTDAFTYTVSDGRGGSATGTVVVTVVAPVAETLGLVVSGPAPVLTFQGVPYRTYRVLVSPDLENWTLLEVVRADGTGLVSLQDQTTPRPAVRFYRAVYP